MVELEQLIRILAIITGVITLSASMLSTLRQSRRAKGRSSGRGADSRAWPFILLTTAGFVTIGVILWQPIPLYLSNLSSLLLSAVGVIVYFSGTSLYLWGLVTLGSQFGVSGVLGAELYKEHELITSGPFAIIRHPLYAGVLLAAFGALLVFRTWAMVVFMPMSLVVVARAEREEEVLEQEFADEWEAYAAKVPKWFPIRR
jgi:protein-S-isoprenylcysteine O-methyltransferase Ste14